LHQTVILQKKEGYVFIYPFSFVKLQEYEYEMKYVMKIQKNVSDKSFVTSRGTGVGKPVFLSHLLNACSIADI